MNSKSSSTVMVGMNLSCLIALIYGIRASSSKTRVDAKYTSSGYASSCKVGNRASLDVIAFVLSSIGPREYGVAGCLAIMLFVRTWCDLHMIRLMTSVETNLVARRRDASFAALRNFAAFMIPVSAVNALLTYAQDELKISLRERLTRRLMQKFMRNNTYYHITNPTSNDRHLLTGIAHPDHVMSHDVEEFAKMVAALYAALLKPIVDVSVYSWRLWEGFGASVPLVMTGYLLGTGLVVNSIRRPLANFASGEQQLEGAFHAAAGHVVAHSEQIAFIRGARREHAQLTATFRALVDYIRHMYIFRRSVGVLDQLVAKYGATLLGWLVICRPFLDSSDTELEGKSHSEVYLKYNTVFRMTLNLAQAVGNIVISGRDLLRVTGIGRRLMDFDGGMAHLCHGVSSVPDDDDNRDDDNDTEAVESDSGMALPCDSPRMPILRVKALDITLPTGEVLARCVTFTVERGSNLLVVGPNGSGKSSLLRQLGNLWQTPDGAITWPCDAPSGPRCRALCRREAVSSIASDRLTCPSHSSSSSSSSSSGGDDRGGMYASSILLRPTVMFFSQKPYLPLGTLAEVIIYPLTYVEACARWRKGGGRKQQIGHEIHRSLERHLKQLLKVAHLSHLLGADDGAVSDGRNDDDDDAPPDGKSRLWQNEEWAEVLSGGERQRLCLARLYFHRPLLAILDECTSAVSSDVELSLYKHCEHLGITVISVSHKRSLVPFHSNYLRLTGSGEYETGPIVDPEKFHV